MIINETLLTLIKKNRSVSHICNELNNYITMGRWEYFPVPFESIQLIEGNILYTIKGKSKVESIKPGRFIMKFFPNKWNDKDIEKFSNICSSLQKKGEVLEVISGNKIPYYYSEYNYFDNGRVGSLWKSCMRHDEMGKYFKIYQNNPELCSMLVLTLDGYVQARALLWENVVSENGDKFKVMDRIYTTKDSQIDLFKNWAFDNGYYCKIVQSHKDGRLINLNGEILDKKLYLPITWEGYNYYPYFDTFRFLDKGKNLLSNQSTSKEVKLFQSTKGQILTGVFDSYNKEYIKLDKALKTFRGEWISQKDAIMCEWFEFWGNPDDVIWSDIYRWIPKGYEVYSDFYKTYIIKEQSVQSKMGWIPKNKAIEIGGEIYDKSLVYFSKTYNRYIFKNKCNPTYCYNQYDGTFIDFILDEDSLEIGGKFFFKNNIKKIGDVDVFIGHIGRDGKIKSEFDWLYYGGIEPGIKYITEYKDLLNVSINLENKKLPGSKKMSLKSPTKKSFTTINLRGDRAPQEIFDVIDEEEN